MQDAKFRVDQTVAKFENRIKRNVYIMEIYKILIKISIKRIFGAIDKLRIILK